MQFLLFPEKYCVCRLTEYPQPPILGRLHFLAATDQEISLVCEEALAPGTAAQREGGFRAMRIDEVLEFSLTGILAGITSILAKEGIAVFAVSTFDTDYLLIKDASLSTALTALEAAGHTVSAAK